MHLSHELTIERAFNDNVWTSPLYLRPLRWGQPVGEVPQEGHQRGWHGGIRVSGQWKSSATRHLPQRGTLLQRALLCHVSFLPRTPVTLIDYLWLSIHFDWKTDQVMQKHPRSMNQPFNMYQHSEWIHLSVIHSHKYTFEAGGQDGPWMHEHALKHVQTPLYQWCIGDHVLMIHVSTHLHMIIS